MRDTAKPLRQKTSNTWEFIVNRFFFSWNLCSFVTYFWYRQVLTLKFGGNQTATEHKLIWDQKKVITLKETDFENYFHIYVCTWGGHCSIIHPGSYNMSRWMLIRWTTGPKNNIHTYGIAMQSSFALDSTLSRCTQARHIFNLLLFFLSITKEPLLRLKS